MSKPQNKDFFHLVFNSAKKSLKEHQEKDEAVIKVIENIGRAVVEEINKEDVEK
jgi:BioD-like phosphotransacetylase family protein